ncbi:helix-turn-helix domain-containing protein [Mesorhizobium sp. CA16]|uniref:helix-turn-helix domain-containing protein n=1 Tax=Mesorhizobium sp. CA16 TaxID=588496 RepID=UPI001CCCBBDC|nr:helix-turn-helix domain-containing protein [Mesorhizobium sp. CA16]MBZ9911379.1 helix-turn-helix domain-containing protein [Mesorhizobium sp. CA16]
MTRPKLSIDHSPAATANRPRLATDVKGAVDYTGLCRAQLYKDMRAGLLVARKKGSRTILLYEDLDRYLKAMPEAKFKPMPMKL